MDDAAAHIQNPFNLNYTRDNSIIDDPIVPIRWADQRVWPLYASLVSVVILVLQYFVQTQKKESSVQYCKTSTFSKLFEYARLLGSLICIALAVIHSSAEGEHAVLDYTFIATLVYASILLLTSVAFASTSTVAHNLLLSVHAAFIHLLALATLLDTVLQYPPPPSDRVKDALRVSLLLTGLVVPLFIERSTLHSEKEDITLNPSVTASLFSAFFYTYLDPLVWLAAKKKDLDASDLPNVREEERADWLRMHALPVLDPLSPSRTKWPWLGVIKIFRWSLFYQFFLEAISIVNSYAGPISTLMILRWYEAPEEMKPRLIQPWVWILWLVIGVNLESVTTQMKVLYKTHNEKHLEMFFNQLVFDHALRVRLNTASTEVPSKKKKETGKKTEPSSTNGTTTPNGSESTAAADGASTSSSSTKTEETKKISTEKKISSQAGGIVNLLTTDASNITTAVGTDGLMTVCRVILTFYLLYKILDWSALVGAAALIVTMPIPGWMTKLRAKLQKNQMGTSDERLQYVTQVMNVIRMIKLFGWEPQMEAKIAEIRNTEVAYIWKTGVLDMGIFQFTALFPSISMIVAYACFVLVMGRPLNASVIFSSITLFDMLQLNVLQLSWYLPMYVKAKVSMDRMMAFLNSGEYIAELISPAVIANTASRSVFIRDARFTWRSGEDKTEAGEERGGRRAFQLRIDGELKFVDGTVNLITGPTGCGKTSLLYAILGEMVYESLSLHSVCKLARDGGVAFGAQESWVMNQTIRENILFGSVYDETRYNEVIRETALDKDLSLFDAGDATEVGEKGITLSGGQKARVTLARAVYSQAKVLLLDDVLSALDVHTSRWIVKECLGGKLLRGRTVLLVTHNVVLAQSVAKYLITLKLDGTVGSSGPIEQVLEQEGDLVAKLQQELIEAEKLEDTPAEDKAVKDAAGGKLIVDEEKAIGRVSWSAWRLYITALGGLPYIIGCTISWSLHNSLPVLRNGFLAYWSTQYETMPQYEVPVQRNLLIWSMFALITSMTNWIGYIFIITGFLHASRKIHAQLIHSILRAPLRWLDTTPISRVLTRCSQDTDAIDSRISHIGNWFFNLLMSIVITSVTVVAVTGWVMLVPAVVVIASGWSIGRIYLAAQLPTKRLLSNARSPIMAHIQSAMIGLVSLRAYGAQERFTNELIKHLNSYGKIAYPVIDLSRWISVRIDVIGSLFSGIIAGWLVYGRSTEGATIGFSLALISSFNNSLLFLVRSFNALEVEANSLERVRDYLEMPHEPEDTEGGKPPAYWPSSGELEVDRLSARYSDNGPLVLKEITFKAKSGEKIGIVGRTGAGKSSLALALLRAIPTTGTVTFDGQDTFTLNLSALRSAISIIPQSPELLAGTLRQNLDPLGEHDDAVLNHALGTAGLKYLRTEEGKDHTEIGLDTTVESGGSNFSQGQRQIIALARAFMRRSKILILDEATAAIDHKTDALIQEFIRTEFKDVTIITVAHRLQTIMDSDRILVLDAGSAVEWGSPKELLEQERGYFKSLVDESSDKDELYAVAEP